MAADPQHPAGAKPEKIVQDGRLYAVIVPSSFDAPGLQFFSSNDMFIQVGQWLYNRGHRTVPHAHLHRPRNADLTQEAVHIVRGMVGLDIYDGNDRLIRSVMLRQGDTAILTAGGHAYTILEDGTKVLEFKNGPYTTADEDRRLLT